MHVIQIIRNYLGLSQLELAKRCGITQPDLCEMEIKPPYGKIDKYQRLSNYLGIPIHALVCNDCTQVPLSFFEKHPCAGYKEKGAGANMELGRAGEESALAMERERLEPLNPSLAKLVLPQFKLGNRPGYDILSFDDTGKPVYIEVKTTKDDVKEFVLTKQEYNKANKVVENGGVYLIYRYTNYGSESQELRIYDFGIMKIHGEVLPATYMCSAENREQYVTGLRYYRELRGLGKGEMADYLGIQTPHLWRYETGERRCSVEMYQRIANVLDVTIDEVLKTYPAN